MGGLGSSRWDGHTRRILTDECRILSSTILSGRRWERLDGRLVWGEPGSPTFALSWSLTSPAPQRVALEVRYVVRGERQVDRIPIDIVATTVGRRHRFYFRCPGCLKRVVKLYKPVVWDSDGHWRRFRCRRCHGLAYRSQLDQLSSAEVLERLRSRWQTSARFETPPTL